MNKILIAFLLYGVSLKSEVAPPEPRLLSAQEIKELVRALKDTEAMCSQNPRMNRGVCTNMFYYFSHNFPEKLALAEQLKEEVKRGDERNAYPMPLTEQEVAQAWFDGNHMAEIYKDYRHPDYTIARARALALIMVDPAPLLKKIALLENAQLSEILSFKEFCTFDDDFIKKHPLRPLSSYNALMKKKYKQVKACFDDPNPNANCRALQKKMANIAFRKKSPKAAQVAHIIKAKYTE
jgi:hypothetical protein